MNTDFRKQAAIKTNEELLSIYGNADDYQEEFIDAVISELGKRNLTIDGINQEREKIKQEKALEIDSAIETGQQGSSTNMTIGFISACLGGLIGIYAGYHYSKSHKINSKGEKCYTYNESTRRQGSLMMIIGIFVFIIVLAWKLGL
jgi:hypothetical protein